MSLELEIDATPATGVLGATLFDCAEAVGIHVPTSCHKNGKCRECMVEIIEGMTRLEARTPEEEHLGDGFRLACRARIAAATGTLRCRTLRRGALRIESGTADLEARLAPLDTTLHRPAVERRNGHIYLDGTPIAASNGPIHGLAMDVGTTTVVVRLVDLESGRVVATSAFENPQRFGGSDVMARIRHDTDHPGKLLQRVLLGYLCHAIEEMPGKAEDIYEVMVAGNPTMRDLLFGLDVHSIGQRPYRSLTEHELRDGKRSTTSLDVPARKLRLPVHPAARVRSLPLISGHVGADAAATLLATGLHREERLVAIMDIGTNTELLVGNRDRLFVASCPAGPAFEGGLVQCGLPALEGAIEAVRLDDQGAVTFTVIGDGTPQGICGSGLVDLLGELVRTGRMSSLGRFTDDSDRFVVDPESSLGLSEMDVSHLAQAKGANVAGIRIVLNAAGLDLEDLDVFYLAGGFARHINVDAAKRIGLIPDLANDKICKAGNAALLGATRALLSTRLRQEVEDFVRTATHVELETDPNFFDHFVDGCQFRPVRSDPGEESPT